MRKGMGKGKGKGYKNLTGKDPKVHSMSAKGMKQPQKLSFKRYGIGNEFLGEDIYKILPKREVPNDLRYQGLTELGGRQLSIYYSPSKNMNYGYWNGKYIKYDEYKKSTKKPEAIFDIQRANRNKILLQKVRDRLISKRLKENPSVLATRVLEGVDNELAPFIKETEPYGRNPFTQKTVRHPVKLLRKQPYFKKLMSEAGVK